MMKEEVCYQGMTFKPMITNKDIQQRIAEIGQHITADYSGREPLFIVVLNGAFPFAADLIRAVDLDSEISFIRYKSYEGTGSTGKIKQIIGLSDSIEGKDIIVVEDIVDTGFTIRSLLADLRERHPASIRVASLLYKPEAIRTGYVPDYVGFEIPTKFIIGFGLDIDGKARNLNDIYVLSE